jgi:hypothetical protein
MNKSKMIMGLIGVVSFCWVVGTGEQKVAYAEFTIEPMPTTISYQGRLLKDGVPVTGTLKQLKFQLLHKKDNKFEVVNGGEELRVKLEEGEDGVKVTNGIFTAKIEVDVMNVLAYFDGRALWLKLVDGEFTPNGGSSESIGPFPEQQLLPAPYALTLRPGTIISGDSALATLNVSRGKNTPGPVIEAWGGEIGVMATSQMGVVGITIDGVGVKGSAVKAPVGTGIGVKGYSHKGHAIYAESEGKKSTIAARNKGGGRAIYAENKAKGSTIWAINNGEGRAICAESIGKKPTIEAINNGDWYAGEFKGAENDGTMAALKVVSTKIAYQEMLLDGNEIDVVKGDKKLWLNNNSKGNVVVPVLEITGGSDIAEPFDIRAREPDMIKPGMVVSIDPEYPGKLKIATKAYDRCVAGIISGAGGVNSGMLMRQSDSIVNGEYPVALTGRVYCWADTSNGPIQPGDLLTTSNTPGHAMKVTDYARSQGAILGKAMTSLEKGTGLVLILVTLQ